MKNTRSHLVRFIARIVPAACIVVLVAAVQFLPNYSLAQSSATLNNSGENVNISDSNFKLVVCDRPAGAPGATADNTCDYNGLIRTVQHFINVAMVLGVFAAIVGFTYGGFLYISGNEGKINRAKEMFRKIGIGFVLMLTGWFIVYQILVWLARDSAVTAILGKPN